jgi:prepilin-type N-terminal cleavage/methylation domain-containing protein
MKTRELEQDDVDLSPVRTAGFSIIELLIVIGIIGILAAIVIPNYLNALNRAKQKTTMGTMRAIAMAWEARATETKSYNAAAAQFTLPSSEIDSVGVTALLTPTYIRILPIVDGWGHPLDFFIDALPASGQSASAYAIRSRGRDGILDNGAGSLSSYTFGTIKHFDCDIVFGSGTFVTEPQGVEP